jgi:pimeloyl-ACP methyl ester carboxylesterase
MKVFFVSLCISLLYFSLHAQSNVRAWYAQGQVWVVWEYNADNAPVTFEIYKRESPFNSQIFPTENPVGRLFEREYSNGLQTETIGPDIRYRIPGQQAGTTYLLAPNEGLFVETVVETATAYYAVLREGQVVVDQNNRTNTPLFLQFDPDNPDLVNCHLQHTEEVSGNDVNWYCMWSLGQYEAGDDPFAARSDFPITANAYKNGMPSIFAVAEPSSSNYEPNAAGGIPATHWLHGIGAEASKFLPGKAPWWNIQPEEGILISHNDDVTRRNKSGIIETAVTFWYGYPQTLDPFVPSTTPSAEVETYNYTQRRILWINDWLQGAYNVDPDRISVQGYSMGSAGALALAKAYPEQFSSVSVFNHQLRPNYSKFIFGQEGMNSLNLRGPGDAILTIEELWDFYTPISATERDLPPMNVWCGVNDPAAQNQNQFIWDRVVTNFSNSDAEGWGMRFFWDQRDHSISENMNVAWIQGVTNASQTQFDNLTYQQQFRRDQSYPAFFNHYLDENTPELETEDWGTWGGWQVWDPASIKDEAFLWEVTAWLNGSAAFVNDVCPVNSITTDLAIRRPQLFQPDAGIGLIWTVRDVNGTLLQSGADLRARAEDDLVILPEIKLYRNYNQRVTIQVYNPLEYVPGSGEVGDTAQQGSGNNDNDGDGDSGGEAFFYVTPNPAVHFMEINTRLNAGGPWTVSVFDAIGQLITRIDEFEGGLPLQLDISSWATGIYTVVAQNSDGEVKAQKKVWVQK